MAALGSDKGPYSFDSVEVVHRGKKTTTIVNSEVFDTILENINNIYDYEIGFVPTGYEHRPDLISNVFYGDPGYYWLLMLVNNIYDPMEGFFVGQRIKIPKF